MQSIRIVGTEARVILAIICFALGGCAPGKVERKWSEEVALDDGKVLTVDRYVKFQETNSMAGDAYGSTEEDATLSFRGELAALPAWRVALQPLVLYRDSSTNEWVIVAASSRCEVWEARGKPARPYWEFRLRDSGWVEVPLSESSLGRKTNLYILYERPLPARQLTVPMKQGLQAQESTGKKYLSIVSEIDSRYCR
jgi:hypothetical protein